MVYEERIQDLFVSTEDYFLVQCISADFAMGKGIALGFNEMFDMKNRLKKLYPNYLKDWKENCKEFDCIAEGRVLNLVTKERYFNKPTYNTMQGSLKLMKNICTEKEIRKIAMPVIGCGLDRLEWDKVSAIIKDVFNETDIEILVCKQA